MKKHIRRIKIFSLAAAVMMLCGCSRIPDLSSSGSGDISSSDVSNSAPAVYAVEDGIKDALMIKQDFIAKLHAESGVFDGALNDTGTFDGSGYVKLRKGNALTQILNANTPQHYRIILAARSEEGAAISLKVGDKTVGFYYIPAREKPAEGDLSFEYSALDTLYLESGQNILCFTVESGSADIDYILAENSGAVSSECYETGSACVSPSPTLHTVNVMKYLSEVYGNSVLTAQNVSFASNAEIDAVYNATDRYPVIRASEIAFALSGNEDDEENKTLSETEIGLALDWSKSGGLQDYSWHWYSPNYLHGVGSGDFNISGIFEHQDPAEVAMMSESALEALISNGYMRSEVRALLNDIDALAEIFKQFDEERYTVLFHPIPDGDSGLYWWGANAEDYKFLWQLIFNRMCRYHKLGCIIWVWDGSDMDYYPGDNCVDIIGQSFFEGTNATFADRLSALSSLTYSRKPFCVSSCDVMPNVEDMFRDNALWLWTAPAAGDYTLNMNGALSEEYNSVATVKFLYNCTKTIARDELPDFNVTI